MSFSCKKIAQNVAQTLLPKLVTALTVEKMAQQIWATSVIFKKCSKYVDIQSPNGQKIAQSGHTACVDSIEI
jgi:hypothetical protein